MLNKVILSGRLTQDPDLRCTPKGDVTIFTLAVNRSFKNKPGERETDYIDIGEREFDFIKIFAWDKLGKKCADYLRSGRLVTIEGRIQISSYYDSRGKCRNTSKVVANSVSINL